MCLNENIYIKLFLYKLALLFNENTQTFNHFIEIN